MKTDSIFYQLFQTFPRCFFDLLGLPPDTIDLYRFTSVEVKQLAFRLDGVFLPDRLENPIYFVEVQFQPDNRFYSRFFTEIFLYLHQSDLENEDSLTQRNLVDVFYALTHFNISSEFNGIDNGSGDVTKIQALTLILQGDRDLVIPQILAEEIARNILNSELFILPDCGHSPLIDSLDILVNKIIDFLE